MHTKFPAHYKRLADEGKHAEDAVFDINIDTREDSILNVNITENEVMICIRNLRNNKVVDSD